ncbi:MFS transporter [Bacillus lacus]|uniref:MFS transporter n=1 Tax=Metabacillus lacus TaxID=1983721 RepID=A0A7X2J364_9BACI|nr:MFS transporter [Metabacillus lacus]MRX73768.1 MFS transporter [Metabacillus lacus]
MSQLQTEKPELPSQRSTLQLFISLPILSWALYDFANTIFSSNITTIFFPFYLQEAIGDSERLNQIASTFISYANAAASFFLVLFSPLYGVLIDRTGRKKKFIVPLTLLSVACTMLMGIFAGIEFQQTFAGIPLSLALVVVLFVLAKFFYHSSLVFYDPMLPDLAEKRDLPVISGFGVAVGYIGTLVGLTVYLYVGDGDFHKAFIPTALLFLVFSLPLFFFYKEKEKPLPHPEKKSFFSGYGEILQTFKEIKQYRPVFLFMLAYFFLNDAIATAIAMMAVYARAIVGFSSGEFILLYLVSTVASIIGSFIFGFITKKAGARTAVMLVGYILLIALAAAVFAVSPGLFWIAGSLFGVSLGAMWVTSRIFIIELTPEEKRGQFFGLFAFSGKVSSIVGPLLYGTITFLLADYGNIASRTALGSLMVLVVAGLIIHARIPAENKSF